MIKFPIVLKWALIAGFGSLLWLLFEKVVGLHSTYIAYHPYISMMGLLIPIYCIRATMVEQRESMGGYISYMQAFLAGLAGVLVVAALNPPIQWVFHHYINPDFFTNMINYSVEHATEMGTTPEKARAQATGYFTLRSYMIQSAVGALLFGLVVSAISALVITRNQSKPDQ
ncbi:MAG: DUF4199 domain-containing protein [Chitinophagales bacterium]